MVKEALEKAATRLCICDGECFETRHGMMHGPCEKSTKDTAAAIAAFLEALPPQPMRIILGRDSYSPDATTTRKLATAVRRAAEREGA